MILPSKHLSQDRALLTVGMRMLKGLSEPKTVSALWEEIARQDDGKHSTRPLGYEYFVLALDLLFLIDAVDMDRGILTRRTS